MWRAPRVEKAVVVLKHLITGVEVLCAFVLSHKQQLSMMDPQKGRGFMFFNTSLFKTATCETRKQESPPER